MSLLTWDSVGHDHTSITPTDIGSYISGSNQVLEDVVASSLRMDTGASNWTIRNALISSTNVGATYGFRDYGQSADVLVEDSTFDGYTSATVYFAGGGTRTFRRCRFRDSRADFLKLNNSGTFVFEDCFFGTLGRENAEAEDAHTDILQARLTSGGSIQFTNCTFDCPSFQEGRVIAPTSWLYQDAINAGIPAGTAVHMCTQGMFAWESTGGVILLDDCFLVSTCGMFFGTANCNISARNVLVYPTGQKTLIKSGYNIDRGGNVFAEDGTDLDGNVRQAGYGIFSGEFEGLPSSGMLSSHTLVGSFTVGA